MGIGLVNAFGQCGQNGYPACSTSAYMVSTYGYSTFYLQKNGGAATFYCNNQYNSANPTFLNYTSNSAKQSNGNLEVRLSNSLYPNLATLYPSADYGWSRFTNGDFCGNRHNYGINQGGNYAGGAVNYSNPSQKTRYLNDYSLNVTLNNTPLSYSADFYVVQPPIPDNNNGSYKNAYTLNPSSNNVYTFNEFATNYTYTDQWDQVCTSDNGRCLQSNDCQGYGDAYARSNINVSYVNLQQVGSSFTVSVVDNVTYTGVPSGGLKFCSLETSDNVQSGRYDLAKYVSLYDQNYNTFTVKNGSGNVVANAVTFTNGRPYINPKTIGVGSYTITFGFKYYNNSSYTIPNPVTLTIQASPYAQSKCGTPGGACSFSYCQGSGLNTLSTDQYYVGNNTGAFWSGSNVSSGKFNVGSLAVGSYSATYNVFNDACTVSAAAFPVNVYVPVITAPNLQSCVSAPAFDMKFQFSPFGGTFNYQFGGLYLSGINNSVFTPTVAGLGTFNVIYNYTDGNNCSASKTFQVNVTNGISLDAGPDLTIAGSSFYNNNLDAFNLVGSGENVANGTWSGTYLKGPYVSSVNSMARAPGVYTATYRVSGGSGCSATDSKRITVKDLTILIPSTILGCRTGNNIQETVAKRMNYLGLTPKVSYNSVFPVNVGGSDNVYAMYYNINQFISVNDVTQPFTDTWRSEVIATGSGSYFPPLSVSYDVSAYDFSSMNSLLTTSSVKRFLMTNDVNGFYTDNRFVKGTDYDLDMSDYSAMGYLNHGPCACGEMVQGYFTKAYFNSLVTGYSNVSAFSSAIFGNYNTICNTSKSNGSINYDQCLPRDYGFPSNIADQYKFVYLNPLNTNISYTLNSVIPLSVSGYSLAGTSLIDLNASGTVPNSILDANGITPNTGSVTYNLNFKVQLYDDPNITTGATQNVCLNAPFTITGVSSNTVKWLPSSNYVPTVATSTTGYFTAIGSQNINGYYIVPTNVSTSAAACFRTVSKSINVNPLPSISFPTGTVLSCILSSPTTLTALPTGGTWSGSYITSNGVFTPTSVSGLFNATYNVTNGNGCRNTAINKVFVSPPTVISGGPSSIICLNKPLFQLPLGTPSGGNWTGNGVSNGYFVPGNGTNLDRNIITYNYPQGCFNKSDTVSIYINPIITVTVPSSLVQSCNRSTPYDFVGSIVYPVVTTSGNTGILSGQGVTLNRFYGNAIPVNVSTINLIYTTTTDRGCVVIDSFKVNVNQPLGAPSLSYPSLACDGDSVSIVPSISGNSTAINYNWYLNNSTAPLFFGKALKYKPANNDNVYAETVDANGCISFTRSGAPMKVDALQGGFTVSPTKITPGTLVKITSNYTNVSDYTWNFGDSTSYSTKASPAHYYYGNGDSLSITLTAKSLQGCTYKVVKKNVVYVVSGLSENGISSYKLYPNPVSDVLNVTFSSFDAVSYKVVSVYGETVLESTLNGRSQSSIDMSGLASGTYVFVVKNSDGSTYSNKIVKL